MNRTEQRHNDQAIADGVDSWSSSARHLVALRLAAERAHAEAGQLDVPQGRLIELRVGLGG